MEEFYTVTEVAKILRIRKNYVYELIYRKKLAAIRLSEKRIRISRIALDNFLKKSMM